MTCSGPFQRPPRAAPHRQGCQEVLEVLKSWKERVGISSGISGVACLMVDLTRNGRRVKGELRKGQEVALVQFGIKTHSAYPGPLDDERIRECEDHVILSRGGGPEVSVNQKNDLIQYRAGCVMLERVAFSPSDWLRSSVGLVGETS